MMGIFNNEGEKALYLLKKIDENGKVGHDCGFAFLVVIKDKKNDPNPPDGQLLVLCRLSTDIGTTIQADRYSHPICRRKHRKFSIDLKNIKHYYIGDICISFIQDDFGVNHKVKDRYFLLYGYGKLDVVHAVFFDSNGKLITLKMENKNGTYHLITDYKGPKETAKGAPVVHAAGSADDAYDQVIGILDYDKQKKCLYPVFFEKDTKLHEACNIPNCRLGSQVNMSNGSAEETPAQPESSVEETPAEPGSSVEETPAEPGSSAEETPAEPESSVKETPAEPGSSVEETPPQPASQSDGSAVQNPARQSVVIITQNPQQDVVKFLDLCNQDSSVIDQLAKQLDRKQNIVMYFKHFAEKICAPYELRARCESNREHSCTSDLLELPKVASLPIKDLIGALKYMTRNDMYNLLSEKISDEDKERTIGEILLRSPDYQELLTTLTCKLDQETLVIQNWYDLGLKSFKVDRDVLDIIKLGCNPTERLLVDYVYKTFKPENLQVGWLRKKMIELDRADVRIFLEKLQITDDNDERSMKDVFKPDSDEIWKLCSYLNKDTAGTKNWRHLALAWGIEHEIYNSFKPSTRVSPTRILCEWLNTSKPDITVEEVCQHLSSIRRNDAHGDLLKKWNNYTLKQAQGQCKSN